MKDFLTTEEAMALTGLGRSTINRLAKNGEIFAIKEKGAWQLRTDDIIALNKKPHKKHKRRSRKLVMPQPGTAEEGYLKIGKQPEPLPVSNYNEIVNNQNPLEADALSRTLRRITDGIARTPKHAKPEDRRAWQDIPIYTFRDLEEQYLRGVEAGKKLAEQEGHNAEENN